jgi:hypothetical protein
MHLASADDTKLAPAFGSDAIAGETHGETNRRSNGDDGAAPEAPAPSTRPASEMSITRPGAEGSAL